MINYDWLVSQFQQQTKIIIVHESLGKTKIKIKIEEKKDSEDILRKRK